MAKQQLDLLKLAARRSAELGAGTTTVVGSNSRNADLGRVQPEHLPDNFLTQAFATNSAGTVHRSKYIPVRNVGRSRPGINGHLNPRRHRHRADAAVLPPQIDYAPATIALLYVREG